MTSEEFSTKRYFHDRKRQLRELFPPGPYYRLSIMPAHFCGVQHGYFQNFAWLYKSIDFVRIYSVRMCSIYLYAAKSTSIGRIDSIKSVGAHDSFRGIKCNSPHHSPSKITDHRFNDCKSSRKIYFPSAMIYFRTCALCSEFDKNYAFFFKLKRTTMHAIG